MHAGPNAVFEDSEAPDLTPAAAASAPAMDGASDAASLTETPVPEETAPTPAPAKPVVKTRSWRDEMALEEARLRTDINSSDRDPLAEILGMTGDDPYGDNDNDLDRRCVPALPGCSACLCGWHGGAGPHLVCRLSPLSPCRSLPFPPPPTPTPLFPPRIAEEPAEATEDVDGFVVVGTQEEVDAVIAATPPSGLRADAAAAAAAAAAGGGGSTPPGDPLRSAPPSAVASAATTPMRRVRNEAFDQLLTSPSSHMATQNEDDRQAGGISFRVRGHHFVIRALPSKFEGDCEVCARPLKVLIKASRRMQCVHCKLNVHKRCHAGIARQCVAQREPLDGLSTDICPDQGLCAQGYKCAECSVDIGFGGFFGAPPVVCDYTGRYYCQECHKGEVRVIPARVLRSWQFQLFAVSRTSREILIAMHNRPCLDVEALNPELFQHVEELAELRRLRQQLRRMLSFLFSCRFARSSGVLSQLRGRRHFLTSSRWYSLKDLMDLRDGGLLASMAETVRGCVEHIKKKCELCKAQGFYCEHCRRHDAILYPFDDDTARCPACNAGFHRRCFEAMAICPKCVRMENRRLANGTA